MEKILGMKVYLELYCKTIKKWREKDKYIKDLGYLIKIPKNTSELKLHLIFLENPS